MPTSPTAPTAVPDFPAIGDASYNTKAYDWATHMDATYPTEMQALATNAYNNAVEANADAVATAADRVQTGLDAVATAADRVATGLDVAATAADAASVLAMDKRYLGSFASNPTLDNQGAALQTGAVCYNTTLSKVLTWNGSAWVEGITAISGVASVNGATGAVTGIATLTGAETLTNKTLTGYTETVYALAGTVIDSANGTIQTKTLAANTTFTESLADGQSVILGITAGAYSVTWPSTTWAKVGGSGTAPTLISTGVNWITLWQAGGTLYGSFLGTT